MRPDMPQVIIERPRINGVKSPKGYRRRWQRTALEDLPRCEGVRRRWTSCPKWQTDLLGPLERFLRKQVGRPWDTVYSEICAEIRRDSAVQDHLRDHVLRLVKVHVILRDGVPCSGDGDHHGRPLAESYWNPRPRFHVCPRTGLLRLTPRHKVRATQ